MAELVSLIILIYQFYQVHKEALDLFGPVRSRFSRLDVSNISIEHFLMSTCQQCLEKLQRAVVAL